jgi:hypothetical protein
MRYQRTQADLAVDNPISPMHRAWGLVRTFEGVKSM